MPVGEKHPERDSTFQTDVWRRRSRHSNETETESETPSPTGEPQFRLLNPPQRKGEANRYFGVVVNGSRCDQVLQVN